MSTAREKIWYLLVDCKTNEVLSKLVLKRYQIWDLGANLFLALITSTSVASWVIWKSHPTLWIVLLASSQVIAIAKPYLLFPKYIKVFSEKFIRWQSVTIDLEELWVEINSLSSDTVDPKVEGAFNEKYFRLRRQISTFDNIPEELIFFSHSSQHSIAESEADRYVNKL